MEMDIHEIGELIIEQKEIYTEEEFEILSEKWLEDYKRHLLKDIKANVKKYY
jgi:hypothetical protein